MARRRCDDDATTMRRRCDDSATTARRACDDDATTMRRLRRRRRRRQRLDHIATTRRRFDNADFGHMTDGRRLRGGQTTDARRMCDGSAAEARRQCDGHAMDGRSKCVRRASARERRLSVGHPPSSRHKAEIKHKAEITAYFGLMTAGRRARDGQTTLVRRMRDRRGTTSSSRWCPFVVASLSCRRRVAVLSSSTRRRGFVHPSPWPCFLVVSCRMQWRQLFPSD